MLNQIQDILEQEKMDCSLYPATEELPIARLLVFLGNDNQKREQILEISAQQQPFQLKSEESQAPSDDYYRIQFHFIFPFKAIDMALPQVASLALFLNQSLDFPGLELNELENQISYRYVWLVKQNGVDSKLVMTIIGIILFFSDLLAPLLERVANGSATFNDLLKEIIELNSQNNF
jgi:hypothetical protein